MTHLNDKLNNTNNKINVLGIPVSKFGVGDVATLFSQKEPGEHLILTFVNPGACDLANKHADYTKLLEQFDVVGCDGIGMVKAAQACGLTGIKRESADFSSLMGPIFNWASENNRSVGFIGGKPSVAENATSIIQQKFSDLDIVACFTGYEPDPDKALTYFTDNLTELVICGMGAPLQEKFLIRLVANGWHGIGVTCGGFLDQTTTSITYYPAWIDRLELRFLYRLIKEPRRLWRRYLVDYRIFVWRFCKLKWALLKSRHDVGGSPGKQK